MNKLLEPAKAVLDQYSKSRSYLSADIDSDVMEALRQAVQNAEVGDAMQERELQDEAYTPMTSEERDATWVAWSEMHNTDLMQAVERAVVERIGLKWGGES